MPKVIRFAGLLIAIGMACGPASGDEKKPNTLTPKEVADGWLMLFDGETTFGWKVIEGEAKVEGGKLIVGGEKATKLESTSRFASRAYRCELETPDGRKAKGGKVIFAPPLGTESLEGVSQGTYEATIINEFNPMGLARIELPAGQRIAIRKFHLLPRNLSPLLNGKDLSGWKVFQDPKRSKSKFDVTSAGEIRVTNGPGDLQTVSKYVDFILRLECKTNGKNLNSGIFFRCVPDQYQNGYEAQIHNGFKDNDRTKPTDFGTGAIYRRVPARKVVANDNEWFTMTVVADGPHIATWVNGYQTVDWTDDRKPADNPRQGLRTAAGHLSIQGHDPTTDILFRNIHITELKK
jgi:hypothetical protein